VVLQKGQENESILDTVRQSKARWMGLILRHDSLLRDMRENRMLGKSTRGRKHLQMLSDITSKDYVTMKRSAEDRSSWQRSLPQICHYQQKTTREDSNMNSN